MKFTAKFGGRPRRRIVGVSSAVVAAAMAVFIANAFGVLTGSPSKFESNDGNMVKNGGTGFNDWKTVTANADYAHLTDASSSTDDSFTPGQKQDTVCPDTTGHGNPNKDDFTDVASFSETQSAAPNHTFLYGATIRVAANGSASENIELKQGKNGTCADPKLLARTLGDKMIAIDYTGGGANVDFHVLTWIETSAGFDPTPNSDPSDDIAGTCFVGSDVPPCWSSTVKTLGSNAAEGSTNMTVIEAADNSINGQKLVVNKFAEFGIDLVAAGVIPENECASFPQTVWESRSSGSSFVSSTKDISIENKTISNCGSITVIKHTSPRGVDQGFTYTSDLNENATAGGKAGIDANGNFSLNDGGNTSSDTDANRVRETSLFPGTYNVTEDAPGTGFAFDSVTCTPAANYSVDPNNPRHVIISLGFRDNVTCTYVNNQQRGAIKVTKTSTKGNTALEGAHFRICTNDGPYTVQNPCTAAKTGSDDIATPANGTICVDSLAFGTYYVSEKSAPPGYKIDDTSVSSVAVDNNATCSDQTYVGEAHSYTDTPLSQIEVKFTSLAGAGVTKSQITCANGVTNVPANSENGAADNSSGLGGSDPTFDDTDEVFGNGTSTLEPGTYTCTVIVDP